MDRNEDEYRAYSEKMPWWCLPYAISTLPKLVSTYRAYGMPYLVVIDRDGTTLTKDGVASLTQDPVGKNFPWRPNRVVDLLPATYVGGSDDDDGAASCPVADLDDKYLLLYFSAHSDAPSKEFTPWLVKAYHILKKQRNDFEASSVAL